MYIIYFLKNINYVFNEEAKKVKPFLGKLKCFLRCIKSPYYLINILLYFWQYFSIVNNNSNMQVPI